MRDFPYTGHCETADLAGGDWRHRLSPCSKQTADTRPRTGLTGMQSFVVGATGIVGGYIVEHLVRSGETPLALSRSQHRSKEVVWLQGDLATPETLKPPAVRDLVLHGGDRPAGGCAATHLYDGTEARCCLHLHQHRHQDRVRSRVGARTAAAACGRGDGG